MKCPSCGAEVAENVIICHSCGARVGGEVESFSEEAGPPVVGAAPPKDAPETPAAKPRQAEAPREPTGSAKPATKTDDEKDYPPPWRYSLKDMRVIWLNMLLLTAAFAGFGAWLISMREQWPQWSWLESLTLPIYWSIILGIPGLLWLYQLGRLVYRTTIRYELDESRLMHTEGIFVSRTNVIELIRIDDMAMSQNLLEKFLCGGIGKVHVHSEDPSDPKLVLRGLENHRSVFRQIDRKRAEKRQEKAFVHA